MKTATQSTSSPNSAGLGVPPSYAVSAELNVSNRRSPRQSGFTLIEMIAVLAVLSILAAALLPAAIKRIDLRTREQEVANLSAISNALITAVLHTNPMPSDTSWTTAAASWSMLPSEQVRTNARRYSRLYFWESAAVPQPGYLQDGIGSTNRPQNLRAMVVSVLGGDALDSSINPALDATAFDSLWSLTNGSPPSSGPLASWNGRGDDFLVQRIDYAPLFHRLVLINRDSTVNLPQFSIDTFAAQTLTNPAPADNPGWSRYYLDGTDINLGSFSTNNTRYTLKRDISFVYELGKWRCKIRGVPENDSLASNFAQEATRFMDSDWNNGAFKGANQQGIITGMYSFMLTYTFWANRTPLHFPWRTATTVIQVPEYELLANLGDPNGRLDVYSFNLIK